MEDLYHLSRLEDKRPGHKKAAGPEADKHVPEEDLCMPFLRKVPWHCADRPLKKEQGRTSGTLDMPRARTLVAIRYTGDIADIIIIRPEDADPNEFYKILKAEGKRLIDPYGLTLNCLCLS